MLYAILCYTSDELANAEWTPGQDDQVMARLNRVTSEFDGDIPCMARLLPTTSAVSIKKGKTEAVIVDGPFIESKEHFVGFYLVECTSLDQAIDFARDLMAANPWGSGYEIRPVLAAKQGS